MGPFRTLFLTPLLGLSPPFWGQKNPDSEIGAKFEVGATSVLRQHPMNRTESEFRLSSSGLAL
ncbi:MAG: hypothetical protein HY706_09785 [Candidatus Hydrogenedentes bacterium]|nr:hypothetical protein [Candidatus Hydrogenedentota bacterium]